MFDNIIDEAHLVVRSSPLRGSEAIVLSELDTSADVHALLFDISDDILTPNCGASLLDDQEGAGEGGVELMLTEPHNV